MSGTGRYLYAIGRGVTDDDVASHRGINDQSLEIVRHRDLDAVVSTVPLDEFGEEELTSNLESLEWLESVARVHDEVVGLVARTGAVAPLRLATICLDDYAVRARLDEWYFALQQVLDRVQGNLEWSVKTFAPHDALDDVEPASAGTASQAPGAGAAYLQRRREATQRKHAAQDSALAAAEDVYRQLATVAVAGRRLRPQDPRLSGHEGTMTLNAAFLVGVDDTAGFEDVVRRLRELFPQCDLTVSGPWPPYSFAMLDQR